MNRHLIATIATIAAMTGLGAVAISCRPAPAEPVAAVPTTPPTSPPTIATAALTVPTGPPLGDPAVKAIRDGVTVGETTLSADAEAPMTGDDVLTMAERGMAVLTWPEGPRVEALGAELSRMATSVRQVGVMQRSGTTRYTIPAAAADGAIGLAVDAAGTAIRTGSNPTDVIVSLDAPSDSAPTDPPTLWIIVIDGAVEITAGMPVASMAGAAPPLKSVVSAGQAIALGTHDSSPLAMPVDLAGIETWYGGLVAGDGPPSAATAAFRCQVVAANTTLREQPTAGSAAVANTIPLAKGAFIDIRGRTKDGAWLQAFLNATELTGWVPAAELLCIAPATSLAVVDPTTVHNIDRAALAAKAPTTASFVQDKTEIAPGACAKLNWDVVAGTQVTFEGQPVPGKGFKVMCPAATSTYTLTWLDESARPQTRRLTVTVSAALASASTIADRAGGNKGSNAGSSVPSPTPCIGEECEVIVPTPNPTATRRPRPTPAPPVQPTDVPPPPAATDLPPPILPTDPPAPEPTTAPIDPPASPTLPSEPPTETPLPTDPPTDPPATPTPEPSPTPTPTLEPTPTP